MEVKWFIVQLQRQRKVGRLPRDSEKDPPKTPYYITQRNKKPKGKLQVITSCPPLLMMREQENNGIMQKFVNSADQGYLL
jgi:hypothetical protein